MSLEAKIFKGVSWIAAFNVFSQAFSWVITIFIARILLPGDYGLMAMATIITEYASIFNEMGLGGAIIQRHTVTQKELSSIFWFSLCLSAALACCCFPISYLTAYIMHEPRVIPLTQAIAVIFIFSGLQIVPTSLLRKEMNFKTIGFIDMTCVVVSCICMFIVAKLGGGVWALLSGQIIRSVLRLLLMFHFSKWRPSLHFNYQESKSYLIFGVKVAFSCSLSYIQEKSDCFFAGRVWKANILGLYTFALQLSQIPTDKIVAIINTVSFPAFSKVQNDRVAFNKLYLNITKVTTLIVFPLFVGGFLIGEQLILLLLNPKWYPMIPVFRLLCLKEIFTSLIAINGVGHGAQGRPGWYAYYNIFMVLGMSVSFYIAVQHGLYAIVIPWLTTYVVIGMTWVVVSIKKFGISIGAYCLNLSKPFLATTIMSLGIISIEKVCAAVPLAAAHYPVFILGACVAVGIAVYGTFFWVFDKDFLMTMKRLFARSET